MKSVCFWVFLAVFGLSAGHAAFAKPNNVYKAVAAIRKSGRLGATAPGAKKNSPSINGTEIHRRR